MSVTEAEILRLEQEWKRKMNQIKVYNEEYDFTYEPPRMEYDRKTGDVTILAKE